MIEGYNSVVNAFLGTLVTWGMTAAGSALVFLLPEGEHRKLLDGSLGFAGGVMIAASFWSLLAPSIEKAEELGYEWEWFPAAVGFALGGLGIAATEYFLPEDSGDILKQLGGNGSKVSTDKEASPQQASDGVVDGKAKTESKKTKKNRQKKQKQKKKNQRKKKNGSEVVDSLDDSMSSSSTSTASLSSSGISCNGEGEDGMDTNVTKNDESKDAKITKITTVTNFKGNNDSRLINIDHEQQERRRKQGMRRILLLVLAITIHNFPEGLAVGVGFGAVETGGMTISEARALAWGIGLQNFPEGLAVSMPLYRQGMSMFQSFWFGQLSGMVEPIAGVLGALLIKYANPVLPYALSFAAGAMIFVVVDDLIPEVTAGGGDTCWSTWGCMVGFIVMMIMDVALG